MERNQVFGSYDDIAQASAAVDRFIATGFSPNAITVLLGDNIPSVEFAKLKGTRVPLGTEQGQRADKPLQGSLGILYPAEGPKAGALDDALNGMGVPLDWQHGVLTGKVLLSVEVPSSMSGDKTLALFTQTGAVLVGSSAGQVVSQPVS